MMAHYPANEINKVPDDEWGAAVCVSRNNEYLPIANAAVQKLAEKMGYHYIDVNNDLVDELGKLKREYTTEGAHMYANAYRDVLDNMKKYL